MVADEYTVVELADAAGMTARNVRAYRQRGLLDPPRLAGRRGSYGPAHLGQLRAGHALRARGLSLSQIAVALREREGELALELLLTEPAGAPDGGRLGALLQSTVETLTRQRPGSADRLAELGVLHRDEEGRYLVDAGLLARANELLAEGARVRVLADVGEVAAAAAHQVAAELVGIARTIGRHDARRYLDLATWAFREALRHALSGPRP
jgi:DNA-binding transcriptional MerR regulator